MTKTVSYFAFSILTTLVCISNSASAVLMTCPAGQERQGSLEITANGRCDSGLQARGYNWNYTYCVINSTGGNLTPGYYQSCIIFNGVGRGYGMVNVISAINAAFR